MTGILILAIAPVALGMAIAALILWGRATLRIITTADARRLTAAIRSELRRTRP